MPWPSRVSSTIKGASRWPRYSAAGLRRPRTASSSGPAASAAMPAASTPIMAMIPEANSTRTSPIAMAPFHTKVIAATASEALHVLDGLLYHQSDVTVRRHHTDGGGDAERVFALLALLGFQFAPRIPDLKNRRLYSFAKSSVYPTLEPLIAGRIKVA